MIRRRVGGSWWAWLAVTFVVGAVRGDGAVDGAEPAPSGRYLFSYFTGNGEDGLHFAASRDGLNWKSLRGDKSFLAPTIGGKLMRDPSLVRGPDGFYHLVWTTGWWDNGFGYARSKDLITWSEQKYVPVNREVAGAKNTWAPDLFYDAKSKQYAIVFATTIPGRFPETDKGGDHNHRQYWVLTKDFETFSKPELAFDPGHNCIDATIFAAGDGLTMIFKDERPGGKRLHAARASALGESWSKPGPPILSRDWVEGPTVLRVANAWLLYFDCYQQGRYGAARSDDGLNWTDVTEQLHMPKGVRHGTAFEVRDELFQRLLDLQP